MAYPQITDYHSAVQNPELCFVDPELRNGKVHTTPLGLPYALSGGFALTYTIETGSKKYAVRCFHREVRDIQIRSELISKRLKVLSSRFFVDFDYEDKGIIVNRRHYPVCKMRWVEGLTLGDYISKAGADKKKMVSLRDQFRELNDFLIQNNIAHGDIQDLNVIVSKDQLVLIDYDGMYVDGLVIGSGNEFGHKDFQHPLRTEKDFGPKMDRFSLILIDLALSIIIERPDLISKYRSGGEALLFKANDFKDPDNSSLFAELMAMPSLVGSVANFRSICQARFAEIPNLREFIAGRSIPAVSVAYSAPSVSKALVTGYISPYKVLDASSYNTVEAAVGQRVELIGQIVDVKQGVGKHGRGRGKPYVFINFGNWQNDCVKLTIWSEGLANFTSKPSSKLVGQWVSVIGLVDPPYEGSYGARSYKNVGITIERESQIEKITHKVANYRLAAIGVSRSVTSGATSNRDVLANLKTGNRAPISHTPKRPAAKKRATPPPAPVSSNQAVLASLKQQRLASAPRPHKNQPLRSNSINSTPPAKDSNAWIFWLIGGGLLLLFLLG